MAEADGGDVLLMGQRLRGMEDTLRSPAVIGEEGKDSVFIHEASFHGWHFSTT